MSNGCIKKRKRKLVPWDREWKNVKEDARSLTKELDFLGVDNLIVRKLDLKELRTLRAALLNLFVRADLYYSMRLEESIDKGGKKK